MICEKYMKDNKYLGTQFFSSFALRKLFTSQNRCLQTTIQAYFHAKCNGGYIVTIFKKFGYTARKIIYASYNNRI